MKIKHLLTKTLLVAAGLLVGQSVWADGNKRVLNAQNYESAESADWTCPNGTVSLQDLFDGHLDIDGINSIDIDILAFLICVEV